MRIHHARVSPNLSELRPFENRLDFSGISEAGLMSLITIAGYENTTATCYSCLVSMSMIVIYDNLEYDNLDEICILWILIVDIILIADKTI